MVRFQLMGCYRYADCDWANISILCSSTIVLFLFVYYVANTR
jgi:hypothetical protein